MSINKKFHIIEPQQNIDLIQKQTYWQLKKRDQSRVLKGENFVSRFEHTRQSSYTPRFFKLRNFDIWLNKTRPKAGPE